MNNGDHIGPDGKPIPSDVSGKPSEDATCMQTPDGVRLAKK